MTDPQPLIGATVGKYQLVEFIGEGAAAKVYKAYHPELKRYASIKILQPPGKTQAPKYRPDL